MATPTPTPSGASGLASSWVTPDEVLARPGGSQLDADAAAAAVLPASEILYALSGRQWNGGGAQATIRPTSRPRGGDLAAWQQLAQFGFFPSWGSCSGTYPPLGVGWLPWGHEGCERPAQVELGFSPVTAILAVRIDGTLIPATEYRLDYGRLLVRTRATTSTVPTVRWGWPTCQDLTLPDTEPNTFSVQLLHGSPPPDGGVQAAAVLASEFAKAATGKAHRLPNRVTSVAREGITATAYDPFNVIQLGYTGLPEVDLWLRSVNPSQLRRRAQVWSPERQRARRLT